MKRKLLLPVFLLTVFSLNARIFYVKTNGNGDGSSWENAFGNPQQALKVAQSNDQIWVAAGKYTPTKTNDRNVTFNIPEGIEVYGGFAGNEADVDARDWKANLTILSGEIGTPSLADNSYSVIHTQNVSGATVVDGFVISDGAANGTGNKGERKRCGAGWYNNGSNGESSPTILNCLFVNNSGREGAGLYNLGITNATIRNCQFVNNRADLDGGAIFNDGSKGMCSPAIENCLFEQNSATYGAGMFNVGASKPSVTSCNFVSNVSYIRGSSIYNNREDGSDAVLTNCQFTDNMDGIGKSVNTESSSNKAQIVYKY